MASSEQKGRGQAASCPLPLGLVAKQAASLADTCSSGLASALAAAGFLLEFVDPLRRFGFGEVVLDGLAGFGGQRVQVRFLGSGRWFIPRGPSTAGRASWTDVSWPYQSSFFMRLPCGKPGPAQSTVQSYSKSRASRW